MPKLPIAATIVGGVLTFALFGVNLGVLSPGVAQGATLRQFAVTIKERKLDAAENVIRVSQGEDVEIVLTCDEAAELHLHGYDLLLSLTPNVPGKLQFTAKIAGRFPLEAHRFGPETNTDASAGRHHSTGPLLYLEVLPR